MSESARESARDRDRERDGEREGGEGVSHVMLEAALVDYVVPGSLPPTTHSHDSALRIPRLASSDIAIVMHSNRIVLRRGISSACASQKPCKEVHRAQAAHKTPKCPFFSEASRRPQMSS